MISMVKKRKIKKTKKRIKKVSYKEALKKLRPKPKRKKPRKRVIRKKVIRKRIVKRRKPRRKKPSKPRVYIGKDPLDQLFESQAKVKLLKFFFRNAEDAFEQKTIFKKLRTNVALLRQEMKKLEKVSLIKQKKAWLSFEKKRGGIRKEKKTVFYLNHGFDFFSELRNLILKSTIASKSDLAERVRRLGSIKLLLLNGIFTSNEGAAADLLIVGDRINSKKLNNFIKDLEAEVGRELKCAVMTSKEFDYRYDMYDRFVRDLLSEKPDILIQKVKLW